MKFFAIFLMAFWICTTEAVQTTEIVHIEQLDTDSPVVTECVGGTNNLLKTSNCRPRLSVVKLIPPAGNTISPSYVTVNRCNGNCIGNLLCLPGRTVNVKYPAVMNNECFDVFVEKHITCNCQSSRRRIVKQKKNGCNNCGFKRPCNNARGTVLNENLYAPNLWRCGG